MPLTGDVTSRQIAGCLKGDPNRSISLKAENSRFVTEKDSGDIAFSDWRGKAWRQGAGTPLPVGFDERKEGFFDSDSYTSGSTDAWRTYGSWSQFYNGEFKGVIQANSYFYTEVPAGDIQKSLKMTGEVKVSIYDRYNREFPPYGHLYVWAYSSGYLSGARKTLYQTLHKQGSGTRTVDATINVPQGYPYVVINVGSWADGKNTVNGQEIRVTLDITNLKIRAIR